MKWIMLYNACLIVISNLFYTIQAFNASLNSNLGLRIAVGRKQNMSLTHRNVSTMLHRMRRLRLAFICFGLLLGATLLPAQSVPDVKLVVTGDVAAPLTLNASDLAKMPREHVDLAVPGGAESTYEGVALQEVLKKAGIGFGTQMRGKALSGYVLAEGSDGYAVVFSLGELDPDLGALHVIVADTRDGKPLAADQGPIRLVLPADKEGARSVRMLNKLEVLKLRK
jgi:DMSO/TMAO reductase YedYZ molybdopterin-dependent catalytic subunit